MSPRILDDLPRRHRDCILKKMKQYSLDGLRGCHVSFASSNSIAEER